LIAVSGFKEHASLRQLVDIWCVSRLVSVAPGHRLQVVNADQQDVRTSGHWFCGNNRFWQDESSRDYYGN
jgi:hypothetical protein